MKKTMLVAAVATATLITTSPSIVEASHQTMFKPKGVNQGMYDDNMAEQKFPIRSVSEAQKFSPITSDRYNVFTESDGDPSERNHILTDPRNAPVIIPYQQDLAENQGFDEKEEQDNLILSAVHKVTPPCRIAQIVDRPRSLLKKFDEEMIAKNIKVGATTGSYQRHRGSEEDEEMAGQEKKMLFPAGTTTGCYQGFKDQGNYKLDTFEDEQSELAQHANVAKISYQRFKGTFDEEQLVKPPKAARHSYQQYEKFDDKQSISSSIAYQRVKGSDEEQYLPRRPFYQLHRVMAHDEEDDDSEQKIKNYISASHHSLSHPVIAPLEDENEDAVHHLHWIPIKAQDEDELSAFYKFKRALFDDDEEDDVVQEYGHGFPTIRRPGTWAGSSSPNRLLDEEQEDDDEEEEQFTADQVRQSESMYKKLNKLYKEAQKKNNKADVQQNNTKKDDKSDNNNSERHLDSSSFSSSNNLNHSKLLRQGVNLHEEEEEQQQQLYTMVKPSKTPLFAHRFAKISSFEQDNDKIQRVYNPFGNGQ